MCTQSLFFATLPTIIGLARELRDSDAREESAVVDLSNTLTGVTSAMTDAGGGIFWHGGDPLRLRIHGEPVHLDAEGSAKLTGGLALLLVVVDLPGAAPSGTVQDAIGLLTDVLHAHARRCDRPLLSESAASLNLVTDGCTWRSGPRVCPCGRSGCEGPGCCAP